MALTIYRRHSRTCPQYRKPRSARYSRACPKRCTIWVQGALGPDYVRRSLKLNSWEAATDLIRTWEDAGRVGERPHVPQSTELACVTSATHEVTAVPPGPSPTVASPSARPPRESAPAPPEIPDITQAIARFTASIARQNLAPETRRKYANLLDRRLLPWCTRKGCTHLAELRVAEMDNFVETWTDGALYATKNLERLRAFFRFCVARDWMAKNPAADVKAPQVTVVPTLPFTDEEMARILDACDHYRGDRHRMRAFVLTMRYSGLRISDTLLLHPSRLTGNNLRLYTTKTGQPVFVPLPPVVAGALNTIERDGVPYFTTGNAQLKTDRANWSRYLESVFKLAKVEGGRSHRFRDTFSCALLEKGASVETVAMLLGNSPAIVLKHYAPWVKARQVALELAVKATWSTLEHTPPEPHGDAAHAA